MLISKCCNEKAVLVGDEEEFFICSKCAKPCDIYYKSEAVYPPPKPKKPFNWLIAVIIWLVSLNIGLLWAFRDTQNELNGYIKENAALIKLEKACSRY